MSFNLNFFFHVFASQTLEQIIRNTKDISVKFSENNSICQKERMYSLLSGRVHKQKNLVLTLFANVKTGFQLDIFESLEMFALY